MDMGEEIKQLIPHLEDKTDTDSHLKKQGQDDEEDTYLVRSGLSIVDEQEAQLIGICSQQSNVHHPFRCCLFRSKGLSGMVIVLCGLRPQSREDTACSRTSINAVQASGDHWRLDDFHDSIVGLSFEEEALLGVSTLFVWEHLGRRRKMTCGALVGKCS